MDSYHRKEKRRFNILCQRLNGLIDQADLILDKLSYNYLALVVILSLEGVSLIGLGVLIFWKINHYAV